MSCNGGIFPLSTFDYRLSFRALESTSFSKFFASYSLLDSEGTPTWIRRHSREWSHSTRRIENCFQKFVRLKFGWNNEVGRASESKGEVCGVLTIVA